MLKYLYFQQYIHRVGRTARGVGSTGNAVILLRPEELSFVELLETEKVYLDKLKFSNSCKDIQIMVGITFN